MSASDDSLTARLAEQALLLADKSRENEHLHKELSRVTEVLDVKLNELKKLRSEVASTTSQLRQRESERDLLAVMLNEAENAMRKVEQVQTVSQKQPSRNSNVTAGEHLDAQRVFHRVLNSLPVGIAELSPEGIVVSANRHLLEITGYSLVDLFGKEACFLFERHRGNTLLMKHLTGSRGLISEARIRRQDRTGFLAAVVTRNMTVLPHDGLLLCIFDLSEVRLELNLD